MKSIELSNRKPSRPFLAVVVIDVRRQEQPVELSHGFRPECQFEGLVCEEEHTCVKAPAGHSWIKFFDADRPPEDVLVFW